MYDIQADKASQKLDQYVQLVDGSPKPTKIANVYVNMQRV